MQVQPNPPPAKKGRNIAVLIVDDEPDILAIFKKALEREGHSTYGFVNPVAALEHFSQNPKAYQMVISDIRMPKMSGFQLAKEIRRINQDVKIVLMSAFEISMDELKKVLPSVKIDGIFEKPTRLEKLNAIIESVA